MTMPSPSSASMCMIDGHALTVPSASPALIDAMGLLLAFGAMVSYVPQIYTVLAARSAYGLSYHSLALHAVTNTSTFLATLVSRYDVTHCACNGGGGHHSHRQCFSVMLPLVHLAVSTVGIHVLWSVAVWYADAARFGDEWHYLRLYALLQWMGIGGALFWWLTAYRHYEPSAAAAAFVGTVLVVSVNVVAALANASMWLPQIYQTLSSRQRGTLSFATLSMQCVGSAAATVFLVAKHMPAGTVVPFLINFASLGILCTAWLLLWVRDLRLLTTTTSRVAF